MALIISSVSPYNNVHSHRIPLDIGPYSLDRYLTCYGLLFYQFYMYLLYALFCGPLC